MWETRVRSLGREDPLEKEMATHSSTLAWRIPWREEPGRLQSMGSQRVRHDWVTSLLLLSWDLPPTCHHQVPALPCAWVQPWFLQLLGSPPTEPTVSPPLLTHFLATPWLKAGKEIRTGWVKERSKAHPGCHVSKSTGSSYPLVLTFKSGLWSAAAAAKSLQSCLTLCDPIDSSPPGSPVPGIFQARTLE